MLKINNMLIALTASAFLLVGCSDSGSGAGSNLTGDPVEITTEAEATNALASISAVDSLSNTGLSSLAPSKNSASKVQSLKTPSLTPASFTAECTYGGTFSMSGDLNSDGSYSGTLTYNSCNEGVLMNGSIGLYGIETDDGIENAWDDTLSMSNFSVTSGDMTMNMNINMRDEWLSNYSTLNTYSKTTISGTMSANVYEYSLNIGYENFITTKTFTSSTYDTKETIDGKMSVQNNVDTCANGIYEFETITPLTPSLSGYTGGTLKVNGATFSFNVDGSADITYADGNTTVGVTPSAVVTCN